MQRTRPSTLRGGVILGMAMFLAGALSISPAFSAKSVKKKTVKNIVTNLGGTLFTEERELVRFDPVQLSAGQTVQLGQFGPLSLSVDCAQAEFDGDGAPPENRIRLLIDTAEDDSAHDSDESANDDFDAADPPEPWAEVSEDVGVQEGFTENAEDAHAITPSGTWLSLVHAHGLVNFAGSDCLFRGGVLTNA